MEHLEPGVRAQLLIVPDRLNPQEISRHRTGDTGNRMTTPIYEQPAITPQHWPSPSARRLHCVITLAAQTLADPKVDPTVQRRLRSGAVSARNAILSCYALPVLTEEANDGSKTSPRV
jgi:hypothetical protein